MTQKRWQTYPENYRQLERDTIYRWLRRKEGGAIISPVGMGRATFLNHLAYHINVKSSQPYTIILIDLNIVPAYDTATFYRVLLRAHTQQHAQLSADLSTQITQIYRQNHASTDPFVVQSALFEIVELFEASGQRLIWILNFFDQFHQHAPTRLIHTLRGLRDHFKRTLIYLFGMEQPVQHWENSADIHPLRHLIERNQLWLGRLADSDAQSMVLRHTDKLSSQKTQKLLEISGQIPSLIQAIWHWLDENEAMGDDWLAALLSKSSVQERLGKLWDNLTEDEKFAIKYAKLQQAETLWKKGLATNKQVYSTLLKAYARQREGVRGGIWYDIKTDQFLQGSEPLENLRHTERQLLAFFLKHPLRQHTHTELIEAAWPDETVREGVSSEAIYQHISRLRGKLEPDTRRPVYLVTWRGQPEGGYQFFPEGKPL